jgi:hypothetical protein
MNHWSMSLDPNTAPAIARARVSEVTEGGSVLVVCEARPLDPQTCDTMWSGHGNEPGLTGGDEVLVWFPASENDRAVILGRINCGPGQEPSSRSDSEQVPDQLVIEGKKNLTLKCGEGSITIRADGKILIKGKDLVSHAQRMNRIKGGSVSIN